MAIGKDTALRLMLVDDQVNEAEAIVSSLRNAGIAVRPLRAETIDELASILAQQPVDMVLAEYASTQMPFAEVAMVVMGCGRDVPLLAVLDGINDEILDSVQAQGAQTVALRGRPQQFLKNVRTEWHDLDARRSQRHLEAQMRETERRCERRASRSCHSVRTGFSSCCGRPRRATACAPCACTLSRISSVMPSSTANSGTSRPQPMTTAATSLNGIRVEACSASTMSTGCWASWLASSSSDSARSGRTAMPALRRPLTMASASLA